MDRTFSISDHASELMRSYCVSASPQAYEIWFTYVSGVKPFLNEAVRHLVGGEARISEEEIAALYEAHFASAKLAAHADRASAGIMAEIEGVMELIDTAVGSTARYDASLQAITADLDKGPEPKGLRDILESLVTATHDVASTNRTLEIRLKESRSEIEGLRETLDVVRSESLIDPLTGIANRKHFEATLTAAADNARRAGASLALVVIDIDKFKTFNDTYGHLTGDQVLRLVASAMQDALDHQATLARFGGEEFAMILPGADLAGAYACAETVRRNVETRELLKRSTGESLGRISVSLGVAILRPGESATSLLERADHCMYRAKRAGRNRTVTDADGVEPRLSDAA